MSDRSFVFGVDLDGVVADFYGGLRPIAAEWLGVTLESLPERVSWGLAEWGVAQAPGGYDALHKFAVMQRELFSKNRREPDDPVARSARYPVLGPVLHAGKNGRRRRLVH
jgi:hypothetical protein